MEGKQMKAVIEGKLYNTETAEEIASYDNGLGTRDFKNYDESLYVTKKGNFFLAGSGGPMTKYARPRGNMTGGGSTIFSLSKTEAFEWCQNHDVDTEVISQYFSDLLVEA
jgi:hypothetical protein